MSRKNFAAGAFGAASELPKDWKTREKMIRYLSYRGFGMGAIQKVLRGEVELPEENADGEF
jgi:regulatory protein